MIIDAAIRRNETSIAEIVRVWFMRIMAVICFVSALAYWSQLLGIAQEQHLRFDVIAPAWRTVSTVLAVVLPVAALGLWLTANWGIVLWVAAISIEIAVYGWWGQAFLEKPLLVFGHLASFAFMVAVSVLVFLQRRRLRLSLH